jgi:hypothetical protein
VEDEGAHGLKENGLVGKGLAPLVLALQGSTVLKCGVGKRGVVSHVHGRHKRPLPGGVLASGVQRPAPIPPTLACHTVGGEGDVDMSGGRLPPAPSRQGLGGGGAAAAAAAGGRALRVLGGTRLLPLLTRRCRSCMAGNRPGILLSPSIPTPVGEGGGEEEGPTTLKLYRKNAAASLLLPTLALLQPKADFPSPPSAFTLLLSNPTEHPMAVMVGGLGVFQGREGEGEGEGGGGLIGVILGPRDELEGMGDEEDGEGAEAGEGGSAEGIGEGGIAPSVVASFPWPDGMPPPTPFLVTPGIKAVKNKAQLSGFKRGGGPLRLSVTVFLHPKAVEEWNGVPWGVGAKEVVLQILL